MKIIQTDNYGRDLPEKEIVCGLSKEIAESACAKLNAEITEGSSYWYIVTTEDYEPLTAEKIYGVPSSPNKADITTSSP